MTHLDTFPSDDLHGVSRGLGLYLRRSSDHDTTPCFCLAHSLPRRQHITGRATFRSSVEAIASLAVVKISRVRLIAREDGGVFGYEACLHFFLANLLMMKLRSNGFQEYGIGFVVWVAKGHGMHTYDGGGGGLGLSCFHLLFFDAAMCWFI